MRDTLLSVAGAPGTGTLDPLDATHRVARLVAGACEAVFMYCAMRWVVFRR